MNDLVGFIVALVALRVNGFNSYLVCSPTRSIQISQRDNTPKALSFGWQRAQLLGAFFNGVFLLALGVSIFLQSIERFVSLQKVENPMLILIMGCVGLTLNIISVTFLHGMKLLHSPAGRAKLKHEPLEHDHDHEGTNELPAAAETDNNIELSTLQETTHPHQDHRHQVIEPKGKGHDLGIMGVLVHLIGDAINNIGVIIAAAVIWKAKYEGRFYADPGVSMGIAIMILLSALPLVRNSGTILLESVPLGVNLDDVKHDLEKVEGVISIHELHAWRLSQNKALASAHVLTSNDSLTNFMNQARLINECLHAYGIHSTTLQPELATTIGVDGGRELNGLRQRPVKTASCQISCGSLCEDLTCCG
ncbi:hypothetical protein IFR04_011317 [Cadophora malorum]|uniref:Zinc/cadmium resistance protein n=1 Tax=Cadophora malorum TaxID=108018 RepID=A0A8H7TB02_9HELO|nr:hypothetical protein IFR04_011317 [Cadophora malorum]